jgi:glycosyltransferase involved in cell wall biosynthesis
VASRSGFGAIVAIPACNEMTHIEACLLALDRQQRIADRIILLLNNCTDDTEAIALSLGPSLRFPLDIFHVLLSPPHANAGHARRLAVEAALRHCSVEDVILTTDADAVVASDWIESNLRSIAAGADVVCGRALIDPTDALQIPDHLHADDRLECRLDNLLDGIAWKFDPEPHDPPPRHTEASGASLAFTAAACRMVAGMPDIESGEDRAFVRALWENDAIVRHDPSIQVTVSGRIHGRAKNGMADAIRRRITKQDEYTDERIENPDDAARRYRLRRQVRLAWRGAAAPDLAECLALPHHRVLSALSLPFFGAAWATIEAASPMLQRRRVRLLSFRRK